MRIPDGWLDYNPINKPIKNVPIIAFKTPLSTIFHRPEGCTSDDTFVEKDEEFTPRHVVEKVQNDGYELAVVIDLTNTYRYYKGQMEFEEGYGIQYDKIKCVGQQLPSDDVVNRVACIINDVLLENGRDSKKLIGIHCTHGVNRTGYVLSRYLIEWLNYDPKKAIEAVGEARGYPVERELYIEDLEKRTPRNGFERWKNMEDFTNDETFNNGEDFATNTDVVAYVDEPENGSAEENGYESRGGYDDYYSHMRGQMRRRTFNNFSPYNSYYSQREKRRRDGRNDARFQQDDFEPSRNQNIVRPPPTW